MKNGIARILLTSFALLALVSGKASAVPLVAFTETEVAGTYQYDFTLSAEPGDVVFELFLDVPIPTADILDVFAPSGWGSISDPFAPGLLAWGDNGFGGTFVGSIADFGSDLFGPASLGAFGFITASQITAPVFFSVNFDPLLTEAIRSDSVPVPEPQAWLLLLTGLLIAGRFYSNRAG